jgi:hypothetical protein
MPPANDRIAITHPAEEVPKLFLKTAKSKVRKNMPVITNKMFRVFFCVGFIFELLSSEFFLNPAAIPAIFLQL